ncbi:MAG: tRNA (adenosine(37)-N6)-threonylcarbamoyltransferase complex ATPase subunit type 1 TsaE [Deltaproteobacteria bacterium]|nr:tRNA (adenosine(37)-N6)-threonylcarbamoyltransferase complex ATPase subunit type 1 TsaE [Deltaproteobacteria bacterium]
MELCSLDQARLTAAARVLGGQLRVGDVVLLDGPMGAGKTTFARALAEGLEVDRPQRVRSPTYNLCLHHPGPRPLAHVDLFRLAQDEGPAAPLGAAAFEALGLDALVDGAPQWVVVVEWAQLWAAPPPDHLQVRLELDGLQMAHRTLIASAGGSRSKALLGAWRARFPAETGSESSPRSAR